jgi:Na+-transporting methylmalonyl-CoA/oxaloacetate decarboxylase gamma subunit
MEEAKKIMVELPLALIVTAFAAMGSAIVAMAVYFAFTRKADKKEAKEAKEALAKEAKENLVMITDVLLKNSESNTALSNSIDRSRDQQEKISQETYRLLNSLTEKIIEMKNGKH